MELFGRVNRIIDMDIVPAPPRLPSAGSEPPDLMIAGLSNESLEDRLRRLAAIERRALALMLAHLGEFDARKLYADRGHPSMFAYCVRVLGYSEQGAYKRIQAARAARAHPALLQHLADGAIHLAAIVVLAPHLRADNLGARLEAARGKTIRELEALAAAWAPRSGPRDALRALPPRVASSELPGAAAPALQTRIHNDTVPAEANIAPPGSTPPPPSPKHKSALMPATVGPRERVVPLSSERFSFHFTAGAGLRADFIRARDLLRTLPPGMAGPMEVIFSAALGALLDRLDPQRRDARRRQRAARRKTLKRKNPTDGPARSRRIARPLRDAVWTRDGGRCTFVGPDGQRCPATRYLEIDHITPYALGGKSDDPTNLRLTCRAHNQLLARRVFGKTVSYPRG